MSFRQGEGKLEEGLVLYRGPAAGLAGEGGTPLSVEEFTDVRPVSPVLHVPGLEGRYLVSDSLVLLLR